MGFIRAFYELPKYREFSFQLVEPSISMAGFIGIGCDFIGVGDCSAANEAGQEYGDVDCKVLVAGDIG